MSLRLAGILLIPLALLIDPGDARPALEQAWPPFVLVAGLLLVGLVAGRDGLFDAAASRLVLLPGSPVVLALACFALVALVTALLNLDTAAVFLTPVLINAARRRGVAVIPFLYGAVFMANASSLFLPGSNLTNLLVLERDHVSGAAFFARMLPSAAVATLLTALGLVAIHRRLLSGGHPVTGPPRPFAFGVGLLGTVLAGALIVILPEAALPVMAVGVLLVVWRVMDGRLAWRETIAWLGVPVLLSLLGVAVALGTFARASAFPGDVLSSAGTPLTTVVAAVASVLVNNLPAAVLLSSTHRLHVGALLLGLNLGPNLAVTGSLAVLLWWRAAGASGVRPSVADYSRQGLLLAPLAIAGALLVGVG